MNPQKKSDLLFMGLVLFFFTSVLFVFFLTDGRKFIRRLLPWKKSSKNNERIEPEVNVNIRAQESNNSLLGNNLWYFTVYNNYRNWCKYSFSFFYKLLPKVDVKHDEWKQFCLIVLSECWWCPFQFAYVLANNFEHKRV